MKKQKHLKLLTACLIALFYLPFVKASQMGLIMSSSSKTNKREVMARVPRRRKRAKLTFSRFDNIFINAPPKPRKVKLTEKRYVYTVSLAPTHEDLKSKNEHLLKENDILKQSYARLKLDMHELEQGSNSKLQVKRNKSLEAQIKLLRKENKRLERLAYSKSNLRFSKNMQLEIDRRKVVGYIKKPKQEEGLMNTLYKSFFG